MLEGMNWGLDADGKLEEKDWILGCLTLQAKKSIKVFLCVYAFVLHTSSTRFVLFFPTLFYYEKLLSNLIVRLIFAAQMCQKEFSRR